MRCLFWMPLAPRDCLLSKACLNAVAPHWSFLQDGLWSWSSAPCNSLSSTDLVGSMSKPHKYLQLFLLHRCHPSHVFSEEHDWFPEISFSICAEFLDRLQMWFAPRQAAWVSPVPCPGWWELLAQSWPVLHPLPNPSWDHLPGAYQPYGHRRFSFGNSLPNLYC